MTGVGNIEVQFWVDLEDGSKELAAQFLCIDTAAAFTALVNDMNLLINIK